MRGLYRIIKEKTVAYDHWYEIEIFGYVKKENLDSAEKISNTKQTKIDSKGKIKKCFLRSTPLTLSEDDVKSMLKRHNFYAEDYNKSGNFENDFIVDNKDITVTDRATGLMWQKSGSSEYMKYEEAEEYIKNINNKVFAGYTDWRIPTLVELMSLMEKQQKSTLHISNVFSLKQRWCWSSDKFGLDRWNAGFIYGNVAYNSQNQGSYIRGVRCCGQ